LFFLIQKINMKKILFLASLLISSGYCAEVTDSAIASDIGALRRFIMGCQASPTEIMSIAARDTIFEMKMVVGTLIKYYPLYFLGVFIAANISCAVIETKSIFTSQFIQNIAKETIASTEAMIFSKQFRKEFAKTMAQTVVFESILFFAFLALYQCWQHRFVFAKQGDTKWLPNIIISKEVASLEDFSIKKISYWPSIFQNIRFEEGSELSSIDNNAFRNCKNLKSIYIPNGVKTIEESAFEGIPLSSVNLPEGLESIGKRAFASASSIKNKLTKITLPDSLKEIEEGAFQNQGLEEVNIPEKVNTLGNDAFENCCHLKNVTFSQNLQHVGRANS
jgi:hypothetical protein